MESSGDILKRARARYADAKLAAESTMSEHMSRSSSLLRQFQGRINGMQPHMSTRTQMSYVRSLKGGSGAATDDNPSAYDNTLNMPMFCNQAQLSSSWPSTRHTPKQMTQAMWISQTATVHSNISEISNWEDTVKIPEILMTDPADVLCGKTTALNKSQDEERDTLSELLKDTSYEMALEADVGNSHRAAPMFSQHVASVVDYAKTTPTSTDPKRDTVANQPLLSTLVNDTCTRLEGLTREWQPAKGSGARLVDANGGLLKVLNDSCDDNKLSDIDSLYLKTFGTRSGVSNSDKGYTLTHALLHINQLDNNREAELAPKICVVRPLNEVSATRKASTPSRLPTAGAVTPPPLSETVGPSNLLESVNILCEDKYAVRLHKMSDFNRSFAHVGAKNGSDVEIQTDAVSMPEPKSADPLKSASKVKVVYSGNVDRIPGSGEDSMTIRPSNHEVAAEKSASAIISNVKPRLPDPSTSHGSPIPLNRNPIPPLDVRARRDVYRGCLDMLDEAERRRWQQKRAPLYEKMRDMERCGMRMSAVCRGGRRGGSRLTHGAHLASSPQEIASTSPTTKNADNSPPSTLIYESPSNRIRQQQEAAATVAPSVQQQAKVDSPRIARGYYGYDDMPAMRVKPTQRVHTREFFATPANRPSSPRAANLKSAVKGVAAPPAVASGHNPFEDFDGWWNQHSVPLSTLRQQLSIS
ncbi:hemolysin secretion D, putative [Babesia ovata]|uniref:Hemolysin secretion D, putative n=1 Tax=Babesia ovata TaxID=189622 RepID=A0A2H6KB87_9APIC|nr:hemolysin secretion D, putative [Babesia ovata]GBE60257.1 hemolysin secretion D, putative [Babesia ovata]